MIVYNNETIKNLIMDALDKMERGIEISEVDRNELINVILKGDRDFGIKNKDTGKDYTEEELQCSIYIHINEVDENKCYIGQTSINPKRRWKCDGNGYCKGQVIYNAIKKYGWNNISHVVLCYGLNKEQVNDMEVALISLFKSTNREFGYNLQTGGSIAGKHSEESKKKISEAMKGRPCSEETRKKMSESNKGKLRSEETRNKISEAKKGKYVGENNYWYGKHHSEESIEKMREVKKGKYVGENNPMFGKHHSEESKKKQGEAMKGKHRSEESKKKQGEAMKGKNNPKAKKVFCNEMIFQTTKECSEFYNVNYSTMRSWLQGKNKTPSEFIEKGLKFATTEDIEKYPLYIEEEQNQQN